jgi:hypothetical protein
MLTWRAGDVARKERAEDVFELLEGGGWRYIGTMVSAAHARRACAVTRPNPYVPHAHDLPAGGRGDWEDSRGADG